MFTEPPWGARQFGVPSRIPVALAGELSQCGLLLRPPYELYTTVREWPRDLTAEGLEGNQGVLGQSMYTGAAKAITYPFYCGPSILSPSLYDSLSSW